MKIEIGIVTDKSGKVTHTTFYLVNDDGEVRDKATYKFHFSPRGLKREAKRLAVGWKEEVTRQ